MVTPVEDLGWSATRFVVDLGRLALFGFQVVRAALPPPLRVRRFVQEVFKLGVLSLIIISVCGLAVGMVLSLQGYNTLVRFGAEQSLGAVVGLSLIRELGPVLTALLATGRAGSATTAEIGTMVATEQLDVRTLAPTVLLVCTLSGAAAAADGPRAVVEAITGAALDVLGNKSFSVEDKRQRLETIVYAHVDFDTVSRLVLARNWSQLSPAQQADFVKLFKEHLSMTYGRSIENYKNERVEISGDHEEARGDWTVKTKILRGGGANDILVDYRLRKEDAAWRIIDIVIERVSLVINYRSQFQEIVSQGGPTKLLEVLREKNARREPLKS